MKSLSLPSPSPAHRCWGAATCLKAISVAKLNSARTAAGAAGPCFWSDAWLALVQLAACQGLGPSPQHWLQCHWYCCWDSACPRAWPHIASAPSAWGPCRTLSPAHPGPSGWQPCPHALLTGPCNLVLSANLLKLHPVTLPTLSAIQSLNSTRPSTDPCGPYLLPALTQGHDSLSTSLWGLSANQVFTPLVVYPPRL